MAYSRDYPNNIVPKGSKVVECLEHDDKELKRILSLLSSIGALSLFGSKRNCVLHAATDSSGNPSYLKANGLVVSIDGSTIPAVVTFAGGYDANGAVDKVDSITDLVAAWTLPSNGTYYLYIDKDMSTGLLSYGYTAICDTYVKAAPVNPVLDQCYFNLVDMKMYHYNSSAWEQKLRVFVAKAVTAADATTLTIYPFTSRTTASNFIQYDGNGNLQAVDLAGALTQFSASKFIGTFKGDIAGNADTATKAIQDKNGADIAATYLPKSGGTITGDLTVKGDIAGNADTATKAIQDKNGADIAATYLPKSGGTITEDLTVKGDIVGKFAGTPTAPDVTDSSSDQQIANLKYVKDSIAKLVDYSPAALVSGCTPSINGLTVTVASGVIQLANGTRKEVSASTVVLNNADSTNPRIDLVYIDPTGAVAKITGTAASTPSTPALPSNGIFVATVSVAANATTGTVSIKSQGTYFTATANKYIAGGLNSFAQCVGYHLRSDHTVATEAQIKQLVDNGAYYIRIPLTWRAVETSQGVYDFSYPLSIINWIQRYGGKAIVTVTDMPTFYATTLIGLSTPTIKTAYVAMVTAFITAAKNAGYHNHILDVYNEPNMTTFWSIQDNSVENFVDVARRVYTAVKAVDATWEIGTPSTSFNNFYGALWTNKAIQKGVLNYSDCLLIHNYVDGIPENVIPYLEKLNSMVHQSGRKVKIIVTETGYTTEATAPFSYATEGDRAKYLPRTLLLNLVFGIESTVLFCAYQDTNSSTTAEKMFGTISSSGVLTDSAIAVKNLVNTLNGYKFTDGKYYSDYAVLQFVNWIGDIIYIAWSFDSDKTVSVESQLINLTTTPSVINLSIVE